MNLSKNKRDLHNLEKMKISLQIAKYGPDLAGCLMYTKKSVKIKKIL